ncbi:transmembrane 220 family protein [Flexithrix dorotheae]|uniref:transmembrane 220 family protein n=1 Tax=Flexithrix dorotheae TaxID=70993 RepID=UPI0003711067|nr:transmembrane 220 family protein [Flexithrix dorotheae]
MKILNIIFTFLFAVFSVVQLNDPDPYIWATFYAIVAGISAFAIMDKYNIPLIGILMTLSLVGTIYLSPGVYDWFANHNTDEIFEKMAPNKIFIEEARECFGLAITFVVLLVHFQAARKRKIA